MALLAKCHVLPLLLALVLLLSCTDTSGKTFNQQGRSTSKHSLLKQMFCPNTQTHWLMLGFEGTWGKVAFPLPTCPNKDFSESFEGRTSPKSRRLLQSVGNNTFTNVSSIPTTNTTNNSSLPANCSVLSLPSFAEWQNSSASVCVWSCRSGFYMPNPNISACHGCKPGTYKLFSGNETCLLCPENTFSNLSSTSCSQCPPLSQPSPKKDTCVCNSGYEGQFNTGQNFVGDFTCQPNPCDRSLEHWQLILLHSLQSR